MTVYDYIAKHRLALVARYKAFDPAPEIVPYALVGPCEPGDAFDFYSDGERLHWVVLNIAAGKFMIADIGGSHIDSPWFDVGGD